MASFDTLSTSRLESKLKGSPPDNRSPGEGFALVNVLDERQFAEGHIAGSINIPGDAIDSFDRFDRDKEIVVYCASPQCDASPKAAEKLVARGFTNVVDYQGGISEWEKAGHDLSTGA